MHNAGISGYFGTTELLMSTTHNASSMQADFDQGGHTTAVTVECVTVESNNTVALAVATPGGESQSYMLKEVRPGVYECDIDTSVAGIYQTMIIQYDESGEAIDYMKLTGLSENI